MKQMSVICPMTIYKATHFASQKKNYPHTYSDKEDSFRNEILFHHLQSMSRNQNDEGITVMKLLFSGYVYFKLKGNEEEMAPKPPPRKLLQKVALTGKDNLEAKRSLCRLFISSED